MKISEAPSVVQGLPAGHADLIGEAEEVVQ